MRKARERCRCGWIFETSEMKPTKVTAGGEVKIIDAKNFPITTISAAIVTLKPGGLRELHWHPNADEWQYYISGKGRMTVFVAVRARADDGCGGGRCRVRAAVESALCREYGRCATWCFWRCSGRRTIRIFRWRSGWRIRRRLLVDQHLGVGQEMLKKIAKEEVGESAAVTRGRR